MTDKQLTQCPQCNTVFAVREVQLRLRDGLVRCGQCSAVFQAEAHEYLVPKVEEVIPFEVPHIESHHDKPRKREKHKRLKSTRFKKALPTMDELLGRRPAIKTRAAFWWLGTTAMIVLLLGQTLFFYRHQLVRYDWAQPYLQAMCDYFKCTIIPHHDIDQLVIAETVVSPHRHYQDALQIKMTLVNRADYVQPFPLVEVSLTNRFGQIVARRIFEPKQYLGGDSLQQTGMPFNVAQIIEFGLTNPGTQTVGYEIRLHSPR